MLSNFCCHLLFLPTYSSRWDGVTWGKLPQCCSRDWCPGAQPDHRPTESPGLCAESVYEGQDDCLYFYYISLHLYVMPVFSGFFELWILKYFQLHFYFLIRYEHGICRFICLVKVVNLWHRKLMKLCRKWLEETNQCLCGLRRDQAMLHNLVACSSPCSCDWK